MKKILIAACVRRACMPLLLLAWSATCAATVLENYAKVALAFEPNSGQTDSEVKFLARGSHYQLFITPTRAVYRLQSERNSSVVRMTLRGANREPAVRGLDPLAGKSHYLASPDPSQWITHVPHYGRVLVERVYPGIDLAYYGNATQLEYDFIVSPGAHPRAIAIEFEGAEAEVDRFGKLTLRTAAGNLTWDPPVAYQQRRGGERQPVPAAYVVKGKNRIGFRVGKYDRRLPLVIDPVLAYSTLLGGAGHDRAYAIAVDASEKAVVTGSAGDNTFPTTPGAHDTSGGGIFVTKLNAGGSALEYSTFLAPGRGTGVALQGGYAYVTGWTFATSLATAGAYNNGQSGGKNAFVAKLKTDGSGLVYAAILGMVFEDTRIAVDAAGNAYVTGSTTSNAFSTTSSAFQQTRPTAAATYQGDVDAFFVKLNASGSALLYSTFLASTENDHASDIAIDAGGMAYVAGYTLGRAGPFGDLSAASQPFRTTAGAYLTTFTGQVSGFIAKFDPAKSGAASLVYSTLLGDGGVHTARSVAVDGAGNAYLTGSGGANFPLTAGAYGVVAQGQQQPAGAFVTKLNAGGNGLAYSAMITGVEGWKIALDSSNNAIVTGLVPSPGSFATVDPLSGIAGGSLFLAKLGASGSAMEYATYIPGHYDNSVALAVDPFGAAYVSGTAHVSFTTTPGAYQSTITGSATEAFVTKVVTNRAPVANAGADQSVLVGYPFTLDGSGSSDPDGDILTYTWTDGASSYSGATVSLNRPQGVHAFTLTVSDGDLSASDSVLVAVRGRLSVGLYGGVPGKVTSSDGKIDCSDAGGTCFADYSSSTAVTLTATPGTGAVFVEWKFPCTGPGLCTVTVNDSVSVGAQFAVQPFTLSVTNGGNGGVTSTPAGINCGSSCSLSAGYGSSVTLKAVSDQGYFFDGWSGACTGSSDTCNLTLQANTSVTAAFKEIQLTSIEIAPLGATLSVGEKRRLRVTGTFSDGSTRELSADRSVDGSDDDTCGILRNGTVKCFGSAHATPTVVAHFYKAVSLIAGTSMFCGRFAGGSVNCDGNAVAVSGATMLASESQRACALLQGGTVACFSANAAPLLQSFTGSGNPIAIGADGAGSVCAVLDDGSVSCAGLSAPVAGVSNATAVVVGSTHACALIADGKVMCWGYNDEAQLGRGTTNPIGMPMAADYVLEQQGSTVPLTDVISITSGDYQLCALKRDSTVKCWGRLLGTGVLYPFPVIIQPPPGAVPVAIAAGAFHTCATYSDGRLGCWGYNQSNTLGAGNPSSLTPRIMSGMTNVMGVSWTSGNPSVGDVTGSGLAIARGPGTATLTAKAGLLSASAVIVVVNTMTGSNVSVTPVDSATGTSPVTVTFSNISQAGETTVVINPGGPPAVPTTRFELGSPSVYYDISTTAAYTPPITICIGYAGITFNGSPKLFHREGGQWVDVTTSVDTTARIVCGKVNSLSPFALMVPANSAPIAHAGIDTTLECSAARTPVTLDGSGSSDADLDPLTYRWAGIFGTAQGVAPTVNLPLGLSTATLTVSDGRASSTDTVQIMVRDTTAPEIVAAGATPSVLWPPTHKMTPVSVSASASDRCDAAVRCRIETVTSNEAVDGLGDGDTAPDWQLTGDLTLVLRAERSALGSGRTYSIGLRCLDASGNGSTKTIPVTVPIRR